MPVEDAAAVPLFDGALCNNSVNAQELESALSVLTALAITCDVDATKELEAAGETMDDELGIGKNEVEYAEPL